MRYVKESDKVRQAFFLFSFFFFFFTRSRVSSGGGAVRFSGGAVARGKARGSTLRRNDIRTKETRLLVKT